MINTLPKPQSSDTTAITAPLVEIFSAIQGEGLNIGTRQIFIRFGGCDLRCRFCDSAHTWHPQLHCQIEQTPGLRDFQVYPNPVGVEQLIAWVSQQNTPHLHDSISLTGGEPLLQADFLQVFLAVLRDRIPLPIYLETGGHLPAALIKVLPYLDSIGMDLKLPSVSGETHWEAHRDFLEQCDRAKTTVFCKAIISGDTDGADLDQIATLVAHINPAIPVFLQPVTPLNAKGQPVPPTPEQVLSWQEQLKQHLHSVRVIPQTHKMIGQL